MIMKTHGVSGVHEPYCPTVQTSSPTNLELLILYLVYPTIKVRFY